MLVRGQSGSSWLLWWNSLSLGRRWIPLGGMLVYWSALYLLGGMRWDHLAVGAAMLSLAYLGPRAARLLHFLWPFFSVGVIYDSMRYYGDLLRGRVRVAEPYLFDQRWFGIRSGGRVLTPNEWWQLHTFPALDLLAGAAYLIFIGVFLLTAAWFRFLHPRRDVRLRALGLPWAFFWVNLLGYSTYYWYPAAPPWYVALYGLGPARPDAHPNPAGAARFDLLLGTHFFQGMYSRSADVFGAIPSLHVAYPLIGAYFALRFRSLRLPLVGFYFLMCFSAVYLNHHYVLDILWGSAYALAVCLVLDARALRRSIRWVAQSSQ